MATDQLFFPPDSQCFANVTALVDNCSLFNNCTCIVTQNMVSFLNLTDTPDAYKAAYCLNPPSDDTCSFGYCDNPDIAGLLVRVASYITNFCLSIMIFYSPEDAQTALWSQLLTMYSLLLTCAISITQRSLSRLYALLAVVIAGSPLSLYLVIYAIISFWYRKHRLNRIVGDGQLITRVLVIGAGCIWIAMLVFSLVLSDRVHFSQASCDDLYGSMAAIYVLPLILFHVAVALKPGIGFLLIFPMVSTALGWVIVLVLQRKTIWPPSERWRPHFGRLWSVTGRHYSFIHFMLIVMIPTLYWIIVIELSCLVFQAGRGDALSFGQVLAAFVALPPVVSVIQLYPRLFAWFQSLTWVQRVTRRWRGQTPKKARSLSLDPMIYVDTSGEGGLYDPYGGMTEVIDLKADEMKVYPKDEVVYEAVRGEDVPWK